MAAELGDSARPRGRRYVPWRMAAAVVLVDVLYCAAVWMYAAALQSAAAVAPAAPGAPIVVFFSSEPQERERRIAEAVKAFSTYGPRPVLSVGGSRPQQQYFGAESVGAELARRGIPSGWIGSERSSYDTSTNVAAAHRLAGDVPAMLMVGDQLQIVRICRYLRDQAPATACVGLPGARPERLSDLWLRPHYEAAAWLSLLLPEGVRLRLLRRVRA